MASGEGRMGSSTRLLRGPGHKAGAIVGVQTQTPSSSEIRIVLFGKTGTGKSASGNTILGREEFESTVDSKSKTKKCVKRTGEVAGRRVAVVDTAGLYDTEMSIKEVVSEIAKCISLSSPGPYAFILVLLLGRFTKEERKAVKLIQKIFGEGAGKYIMILFTRVDDLEVEGMTIEKYVEGAEDHLKKLLNECGDRYHAFNNREKKDRTQVTKLIEKIETMMTDNNNTYYTSEMYQEAESEIQKRDEIMKEKEEEIGRKIKELEEKYKQEVQEEMRKVEKIKEEKETEMRNIALKYEERQQRECTDMLTRYRENAREEAENYNNFMKHYISALLAGMGAGALAGAAIGIVGGPVGVAVGALAGTVVGTITTGIGALAVTGEFGERAAKAVKESCSIQ